jgi:hypothetical protein
MIKGGDAFYIDVSITRPTCASTLTAVRDVQTRPLLSTAHIATVKHKKYDDIARANRWQMIPFVMESYGGYGKEAEDLLRVLAKHATDKTEAR